MERRVIHGGEIRSVADDSDGTMGFTAQVLTYGVKDTFGTQFRQGCFADSVQNKLPRSVWSHDWNRPIGKVTAVRETNNGLEMDFQLSDVPDGRMAYTLIKDGVIDGFSVGFEPTDVRDSKGNAVTNSRMMSGDVCWAGNLVEVSPVLNPAVPGTKTLSVRSDEPEVSKQLVADLLVRFDRGEIDLADALVAVKAEGRGQAKDAEPHTYDATTGDGSVCKVCGGMPDAKIHEPGRSVDPADVDNRSDDPISGIQAVDAAIDEAISLFSGVDPSTLPEPIAQGIALINAADSAMDDVMAQTGIYDADADVSSDDDLSRSAEPDADIEMALALINRRIA